MKTLLKTASTAIKRAALLFQIRSLEITLAGQLESLSRVTCLNTREQIIDAMDTTRCALIDARRRYLAAKPVAQCHGTWRAA